MTNDHIKKNNSEVQLNLFGDVSRPQVFTCVAGAYIGKFNDGDAQNPVERLSGYFASEELASDALFVIDQGEI